MTPQFTAANREALRRLVRSLYDFQRLKNQAAGRGREKPVHAEVQLDADDIVVLDGLGDNLEKLEAEALQEVTQRVRKSPIWPWLDNVNGIGPLLAGVFITEIDIAKAPKVSSLWRYAGCDPSPGGRRHKDEKSPYNGFLKTKLLGVAADCILKACVRQAKPKNTADWKEVDWHDGTTRWIRGYARLYAEYRWRLVHRVVECMTCNGAGFIEKPVNQERAVYNEKPDRGERAVIDKQPDFIERATAPENSVGTERAENREQPEKAERAVAIETPVGKERAENKPCYNCHGTGRAPWGRSDAHRHRAAIRYMMKIFLQDLYVAWRTAEGLEVRPPYAVEKLGKQAHAA